MPRKKHVAVYFCLRVSFDPVHGCKDAALSFICLYLSSSCTLTRYIFANLSSMHLSTLAHPVERTQRSKIPDAMKKRHHGEA